MYICHQCSIADLSRRSFSYLPLSWRRTLVGEEILGLGRIASFGYLIFLFHIMYTDHSILILLLQSPGCKHEKEIWLSSDINIAFLLAHS